MMRARTTAIILLVLSLAGGLLSFTLCRYNSSTLVIYARTLEKGVQQITVKDREKVGGRSVSFEIGSDQGEPSFYTIQLPPVALASIKIPPLATAGKFEINRITLANSFISYNWDQQLACTRQLLQRQPIQRDACADRSPSISPEADGSLVIAAIPEDGFYKSFRLRALVAVLTAFGIFCGGFFLLRPVATDSLRNAICIHTARAGWLALVIIYGYQLSLIGRHAVDIPFWEEWEYFEPFALPGGLTFRWLFHHLGSNQQIMVFTKLVAWLDYRLFGLDFVTIKIFNYLLFGGLLYAIVRFKNGLLGKENFRLFPFFLLFLVSNLVTELHMASFLSGQTFMLLFAMGMLHYIKEPVSHRDAAIFSLLAILAIYSLAAGMVIAMVVLLCRTLHLAAGIASRRFDRHKGLYNILVSWGIVLPGILLWFIGFNKSAAGRQWLLPFEPGYWEKFFSLVGFGFGFETENPLPGLACLVLVAIPLLLLLARETTRWQPTTWQLLAAVSGIMAILGQIVMGRGNMPYSILIPHYAEFAFLLIPFTVIAWWLALQQEKWQTAVITALFVFCAISYSNNWDYSFYRDTRQSELLTLECVEQYSIHGGDGLCPETHARSIGPYFDAAKQLNVHFTRQFRR